VAAPVAQDGRPGPMPAGLGTTVVRSMCMLHDTPVSSADTNAPMRLFCGALQTIGLTENGRIDYSTVTCFRVRLRFRDRLSLTSLGY